MGTNGSSSLCPIDMTLELRRRSVNDPRGRERALKVAKGGDALHVHIGNPEAGGGGVRGTLVVEGDFGGRKST